MITEYIGPSGKKVFGIHHMMKLANINWVLITETNRDEALASAHRLKNLITLLVALMAIVLTILAVYLARRITRPIISLADASMKVAEGEIDQQVEVGSNNEIGQLAESFNHMLEMRQSHEEALRQSAREAQNSLDALADQKFALDQHAIVAITDAGGTITFANDKFSEVSGYSREDLIGQNHRLLNSGYHDTEFFTEMFNVISSGKVWNSEVCNKAKDGSLYWVDTTIVPFMDDNGKPESYIAIRADITERKNTENALSEAKVEADKAFADLNQQKFALDQHAIVAITDAGGTITFANDKFSEVSGYSREDLIGQNHRLLNSGYHDTEFFTEMFNVISSGKVWNSEVCNKAKDGSLYWVDTTIVPFMDDNGKPESYIAIRADITERKNTENALSEAKVEADKAFADLNQQKFALDQHAIVAITDAGGTITFANDKFSEVSGYSREDLIGQNHRLLNSGYHDTEFFTEMFNVISSGKVWNSEVCNKAKDGSLYWVDTTIVPFIGDNGPESYIAIRTDITERKRTEDDLIEAKFEAEAAVLAKGEFLASMSHEIRTPMNGVLGMLGLLLNTNLDHDQHHKAKIAQSSAQSLLTLINDILDFSKVEAGKLDLEIIDFKLHDMLGDFSEAMALQAQSKGLELILDLTGVNQTMVKGDPGRLRQIFTNLVSNAIKFTVEGEVVIRVELQEVDDQHWRLFSTITDTGVGIPEDKLETLFDSFSQVDASTTRKYGGTGLGLSIVKKLSALMGGQVKASSEPGKGSCFEMHVLIEKSSQSQQVVPQIDMQSLNLLVVDDNATNREVLRTQFEQWGTNVVEAESGKEALEICEDRIQQPDSAFFDIALLDMKMPEIDGAELGRVFKEDDRFSDMKLVMMTSIASQGDAKRFAEIGFSAYFPKPATTADLFDALAVVAEGGEALEQAQPLVTCHYLKSLREGQDDQGIDQKYDQIDEDRFESTLGRVRWPANTRVLLVEDNQINQLVAKGLLKGFGLQNEVASNGAEAVDMLSHADTPNTYDLILMDCEMPVMDGYEATREIRSGNAGNQYKEIPIIAMTANVMQGIRQKCTAVGMSDYLAKPIEPELLSAKLQEWLLGKATLKVTEETDTEITKQELLVWDKEAALKRLMGDEVLLKTVLDAFASDMPARLGELQKALDEGDYDQAGRSAHSIKGVAGNLGGLSLQQQADLLEDAAKEEDLDQLFALLPDLQKAQQQLIDCFKDYRLEQDSSDQESDQSSAISDEELITRLQELEVRLKKSDYIDPGELEPLRHTDLDTAAQELLNQLLEKVSQFDNASALKTLDQIAKIIKFKQTEEISE